MSRSVMTLEKGDGALMVRFSSAAAPFSAEMR